MSLLPILMLAPVSFNQLRQRHQSFALDLTRKGHPVYFVEPLFGGGFSLKISTPEPGLKVLRVTLPFRCTSLPRLHSLLVKAAMKMVMRFCGYPPKNMLLWISEPTMAEFCQADWATVLYDRCDLHGSFPGQKKAIWQHYENLIFSRADLISVSHPYLLQDLSDNLRNKSVVAENACAETFLTGHPKTNARAEKPLRLISSGAHFDWIDSKWLKIFSGRPNVELHIAGSGRGKDFAQLLKCENVIFHGPLTHENLAQLMRSCHVGLLPFKDIELINGVDPIKAYEYAASGLEIWAPDLTALHNNPMIDKFIAGNADITDLLASFKVNDHGSRAARIPIWSDRLKTILDRLMVLRSD